MFRMWIPSRDASSSLWVRCGEGTGALTVGSPLPDVREHLLVAVLGADVGLRREEELDLLVGRGEYGGKF